MRTLPPPHPLEDLIRLNYIVLASLEIPQRASFFFSFWWKPMIDPNIWNIFSPSRLRKFTSPSKTVSVSIEIPQMQYLRSNHWFYFKLCFKKFSWHPEYWSDQFNNGHHHPSGSVAFMVAAVLKSWKSCQPNGHVLSSVHAPFTRDQTSLFHMLSKCTSVHVEQRDQGFAEKSTKMGQRLALQSCPLSTPLPSTYSTLGVNITQGASVHSS